MANWNDLTEERVGYGLGLLGGILFLLGALVALLTGTVDLVGGRISVALNALSETLLLVVFGGLALFFSFLGHRSWRDRPVSAGLLLVVVAFLGAVTLGLGPNVLALIGALLVVLAGVLYLVEPMKRAAHYTARAMAPP